MHVLLGADPQKTQTMDTNDNVYVSKARGCAVALSYPDTCLRRNWLIEQRRIIVISKMLCTQKTSYPYYMISNPISKTAWNTVYNRARMISCTPSNPHRRQANVDTSFELPCDSCSPRFGYTAPQTAQIHTGNGAYQAQRHPSAPLPRSHTCQCRRS